MPMAWNTTSQSLFDIPEQNDKSPFKTQCDRGFERIQCPTKRGNRSSRD